ncbi:hypothetical protein BD410DRAFT_776938 [Rickenella mellea]|uniref:BTB domain-containing protein n=1 Tax=Rickenella mellea TaxID=50990 RepID=A0A4Y7PNK2_9AGAM|nr:hypothetical protein BD410DRAFT_776938 [Rickenella mellea]
MASDDTHIAIEDRKRHPTLWFDDGNIILTTNCTLFCVHRGLLSMNSPVFADMLSMPQPDRFEDSFEVHPVVEISDNDTDFTHLMCFFYDHRYYHGGTETTFEKISGLLRMSTKYQMDDLRNEIISHLSLAYPSTLEQYVKAVDPSTQLSLFPPFHGQHFAIATLASETNASVLLPTALWRSMCMTSRDILDGVADSEGTKHMLSQKDAHLCILKKHRVYKEQMRAEAFLASLSLKECARRNETGKIQGTSPCSEMALSEVVRHISGIEGVMTDSHDIFTKMSAFDVWRPFVCDTRRERTVSELSSVRMGCWDALPRLFKLPSWDRLRR